MPPERRAQLRRVSFALVAGWAVALVATRGGADEDRRAERERMVSEQIVTRGVTEPRLLGALRSVPRDRFVPREQQAQAYSDSPLPIGEGQTISQPYVVAKMTELLRLGPHDQVFELGTGSGYQAAVASRLCAHVWTVEIHPALAERARGALRALGYDNVSVRAGDGFRGWPEAAPFDAMLITAAVTEPPRELLAQLKPGGRAVMPVGDLLAVQDLQLLEKRPDGGIVTTQIFPVRFVPATGKQ